IQSTGSRMSVSRMRAQSSTSPGLFRALPYRTGHFRLESGYHADIWLDLDTLFVDPVRIAPAITMLAGRLRRDECGAVCGPVTGGALLPQALAPALRGCFFFTQTRPPSRRPFSPEYP